MSVDHEIRKSGAIGGVKQLRAGRQIGQHISRRLPLTLAPVSLELRCRIHSGGLGFRPRRGLVPARVSPQLTSNFDGIDADLLPPCPLIADTMNRPVMDSAQRRYELVADLRAECTRLHEAQVMGIVTVFARIRGRLVGRRTADALCCDSDVAQRL